MKQRKYRQVRYRPVKKPKLPHGRPKHAVTEQSKAQVTTLAIAGTQQELIAKVMGVSEPTLRKYYREELDTAAPQATAMVARSLYNKAIGNGPMSVTAAIFWLKTHGWKESAQDINATVSATVETTLAPPKGMTAKTFAAVAKKIADSV